MNFKDEFGMTQLDPNPVFDLKNNKITTSDNGPTYTVVRDELEENDCLEDFYTKLFDIHRQKRGYFAQKPIVWDAKDDASRDNIMPMMAKAYQLGLYHLVKEVKILPRYVYGALGMDMPFMAYLKGYKLGYAFLWLHSLSCFTSCFRVEKTRPDLIDWILEGFPKRKKIDAPSGAHLVWARLHPLLGTDKEMTRTWNICTWIVNKRFGGWHVVGERFYQGYDHPNEKLFIKKYLKQENSKGDEH